MPILFKGNIYVRQYIRNSLFTRVIQIIELILDDFSKIPVH